MRILHVHGRYYREGGAETCLRTLIESQQANGHEPAILYADQAPAHRESTCPVFYCSPSHGLRSGRRALPEFRKAVTEFSPDLVHLHVVQYDVSPVVLRWLIRVFPVVMTIHDTLAFCPKPVKGRSRNLSARILPDGTPCTLAMGTACLKTGCLSAMLRSEGTLAGFSVLVEKFWRRRLCHRAGRLVVNSSFTREDLLRNRIPAKRIEVLPVPPGIPADWKGSAGMQTAEPPLLLFVGQLSAIKGASDFVAVLEQLGDLPWQAAMVGDGPERATIEEKLKASGLDRRIELHGCVARKDLAHFYRRAAMLVFPTLAPESLGLAGIEAMWFGLPVVAYDVGAIREWLQNGGNGYLVKAGETGMMADRVRSLLENKPLRESFRLQAAGSARQWLDANRDPSALHKLYLTVIEEKNAHRH